MASFSTAGILETDDGSQSSFCFTNGRNLIDNHSSKTSSSNYEEKSPCPHVPNMKSEEARLRTFSNWPSSSPVQPNDLVQAGLFYVADTTLNDLVQCFCCGGMLSGWEKGDDPWGKHSKFYRNCFFILGHDVGNIMMEMTNPSSKNRFSNDERVEDPLKTLEKLQREKICKVCMDSDSSIVFLPCGHLITCRRCSDSVKKCPMCCVLITQKIKTYCC